MAKPCTVNKCTDANGGLKEKIKQHRMKLLIVGVLLIVVAVIWLLSSLSGSAGSVPLEETPAKQFESVIWLLIGIGSFIVLIASLSNR